VVAIALLAAPLLGRRWPEPPEAGLVTTSAEDEVMVELIPAISVGVADKPSSKTWRWSE
jgi:hypothetical protein